MDHPFDIYGLIADFRDPAQLLTAVKAARAAGYRRMDAYTPFPVEGLAEELGMRRTRVPLITLIGGLIGCAGGFYLQYWCMAVNYPLNVGGRPLNSWPSFIPVTFELTVLCAAISAVMGMFVLNRLPMPYHPVFNVPRFALASRDRFFLCIQAIDPQFKRDETARFLGTLGAHEVVEVPP